MVKYVLAIDPGTTHSGVCIVETDGYSPIYAAKLDNYEVTDEVGDMLIRNGLDPADFKLVIERMYNPKSASSHVFLTCEWIGRFDVLFKTLFKKETHFLYRWEEYKALCGREYAHNDKGIKSALVDRFAYGEPNYGKGTKAAPGWFYGFSADAWSAYAIAITYLDTEASNG